MQSKNHGPFQGSPPCSGQVPSPPRTIGGSRPPTAGLAQDSGKQVRRILVLANRFNSLCGLKSDPGRLVELLQSVIACCRGSFSAEARSWPEALDRDNPGGEQARCLDDLETLMLGLMRGAPEASRGLGHAMDALLIQCVVLDAAASRGAEQAPPSQD
jgi:hypothetical protein